MFWERNSFFYKIHEDGALPLSIENGTCSIRCRQALEAVKDRSGCCLAIFLKDNFEVRDVNVDDEEKLLFDLYSMCAV